MTNDTARCAQREKVLSEFQKKYIADREEYKTLVNSYPEKDLKFFYFRTLRDNECDCCSDQISNFGGGITIVTLLDREQNTLKIGISFCDRRDSFCRWKGKLEVLRRFKNGDTKYVTTVPWSGDSLMDAIAFYNSIDNKPGYFRKWEFIPTVEFAKVQ